MTQVASAQTVLGDFDNAQLDYGGVRARMHRRDGAYQIDFASAGGGFRWSATVERTVGSHHMQQYLARDNDVYFRLPVAWNVEDQRWVHMNGAFLTPDPDAPATHAAIARADYDRHVTRWNDNCIFCHNVAPNPGLDDDGRFNTTTAELGVACEACHGPGEQHARANRDPLRRYALHVGRWIDPTIANPTHMNNARSNEVCGRCHGQRKTRDIDRVLRHGDSFIPGTALTAHSTPLTRDTTLNGVANTFAPRFWNDGTPRLTAYEYQGLLQSPCALQGELTCTSCHSMHDSDANLQLRRDMREEENTLCTQCHDALADEQIASKHSRHGQASAGNQCRACHMPNVVYGIVAARISHRIETPDPNKNAHDKRPDACTLCHVTRTRQWATSALASWSNGASATNTDLNASTTNALPEVATQLFGGDPIQRAVAAAALGRVQDDVPGQAQRTAWLLNTLQHDRYPAVRDIARRSLLQLANDNASLARTLLQRFDVTELSATARGEAITAIARGLSDASIAPLADTQIEVLRAQATQQDIEIGE